MQDEPWELSHASLTTWLLASVCPSGFCRGVLPVTETSPEHACGGREAAEEPVLAAFSHTGTQLSQQPFSQVLSASSLPLKLWEWQRTPLALTLDLYQLPCKVSWGRCIVGRQTREVFTEWRARGMKWGGENCILLAENLNPEKKREYFLT